MRVGLFIKKDWGPLHAVDKTGKGWLPKPPGKLLHSNGITKLQEFLAGMDAAHLTFKRIHTIRRAYKSGELLAIWNYVSVQIPENQIDKLMKLVMIYFFSGEPNETITVG